MIEFQHTSQTFPGANLAGGFSDPVQWRRKENDIALGLMVSFGMIMRKVIGEDVTQGCFSKQDQFR